MNPDEIRANYPGYAQWGTAEMLADFAATGGSGKGGGARPGTAAAGGFQPLTAPDVNKLQDQAFEMLKPYYLQLAKEAQGDFTRAKQILEEDYTSGVRQATEDYLTKERTTKEDLASNLKDLGVTFGQESEQKIDELNKRGMAVYQNNPDGTPNVVGAPGADNANLGRGGTEIDRLRQNQTLRQQAVQRTADRTLETAGLTRNRYTSTGGVNTSGMNPTQTASALAAPGVDRSKLGKSELDLIRGTEQATRSYQQEGQSLANEYTQKGLGLANSVAGLQQKEIPTGLANKYLNTQQDIFKNVGI